MKTIKIKQALEVVTNVAVLMAAIALVAVFAHAYFASPAKRGAGKVPLDAHIGEIKDLDFEGAPRTLVLVLSTGCKYCAQSVPFYRTLASMRGNLTGRTQVIAVFPEDEAGVKKFLGKSELEMDFRPGIDLGKLGVSSTPTLILFDSGKKILNSWVGTLSNEEQAEVVKTISDANVPPLAHKPNIKASLSIFDETSPSVTIVPDSAEKSDLRRLVNFFGVDQQGNVFLINNDKLVKYDSKGALLAQASLPEQFHGAFCVDQAGNSYFPSKTNLITYDPTLKQQKTLALPSLLAPGNVVVKMSADRPNNALYLQIYEPEPLSQVLYKVDLGSLRVTPLFKLEKPVRFSPTLTAGAFDFAVGTRHIYVSDIYEYKVLLYSLSTGKYEKAFSRPFSPIPISDQDGDLRMRNMKIGNLTGQTGYLNNYPPILHLNIAENDMLMVWTSRRNNENRQSVDVYDQEFKLLGTDLKYAHPTISNYVFMNGNVYAPDFGFGKNISADELSPLEVPSLPVAVKVFRNNLLNGADQSKGDTPKIGQTGEGK
jgi:thioredoxin-related protein